MRIEDGTGNSYAAKVNDFGQISTRSISSTLEDFGATMGYTFNVNTSTINLTSANASALLYLKNTGASDLYISSVGYLFGNSTGGSGNLLTQIIRNPTEGTIVSTATPAPIIANKNFGSSRPLNADVYKGVEGATVTDGEVAYESLLSGAATRYVIATGSVIIPRGSSIAVRVTPQTGNSSMDVQIFLAVLDSNGFDK